MADDDDAAIRTLLSSFLQQDGMLVEALASGAALRARLPQGGVDVLVLDLMLPDATASISANGPGRTNPRCR